LFYGSKSQICKTFSRKIFEKVKRPKRPETWGSSERLLAKREKPTLPKQIPREPRSVLMKIKLAF